MLGTWAVIACQSFYYCNISHIDTKMCSSLEEWLDSFQGEIVSVVIVKNVSSSFLLWPILRIHGNLFFYCYIHMNE